MYKANLDLGLFPIGSVSDIKIVNAKEVEKKPYQAMYCKCGCGNGVVLRADRDKFGTQLQLVSDNYYSRQKKSFKDKLERIWCILTGKEYGYFEILVHDTELAEFKEFVSKL